MASFICRRGSVTAEKGEQGEKERRMHRQKKGVKLLERRKREQVLGVLMTVTTVSFYLMSC